LNEHEASCRFVIARLSGGDFTDAKTVTRVRVFLAVVPGRRPGLTLAVVLTVVEHEAIAAVKETLVSRGRRFALTGLGGVLKLNLLQMLNTRATRRRADSVERREVSMASEKVVHVTDASFEQEVMKSATPVLIDFWAPWCAPCRAIAPMVDELATEYEGRLKVVKINVDDNPQVPARFGVRGIPNLVIVKGGEVKQQIVGAVPKKNLVAAVDTAIA
jgi:thioredoxin 1